MSSRTLGRVFLTAAACATSAVACGRPSSPPAPPSAAPVDEAAAKGGGLAVPAAAELTVTFAMPRGDVDRPAMAAVAFNQPMVPMAAVDEPAAVTQITVTPPVAVRARWLGTTTLGIWPIEPFRGATTYEIKIGPLVALSGEATRPFAWTFRTAPPKVVAALPATGAREVRVDSPIVLRFDQPVAADSVARAAHLESGTLAVPALRARIAASGEAVARGWNKVFGDGPWLRTAGTIVVVEPAGPLPIDAKVALVVSPGVHSLEGPEPTREPFRLDFATLGPFKVASAGCGADTCDPDDWAPIKLNFTNQLAAETPWDDLVNHRKNKALPFVRVTPAVPGLDVRCWGSSCSLSGRVPAPTPSTAPTPSAWQAATTYTVEVLPGLTDLHGQKMSEPFKATVRLGHRSPMLDLRVDGRVFETAQGPHRLAFVVRNLKQVEARAMPVARAELARVLRDLRRIDAPATGGRRPAPPEKFDLKVALPFSPSARLDADERRVIDVDPALGGAGKAGAFLIDIAAKGENGDDLKERRLYRVTDLHILAKVAQGAGVFWVTSYATGKAVAGAELQIHDADGKEIWRGATNADGLATGPAGLWKPSRWDDDERGADAGGADAQRPHPTLVAAKGDDWTWLDLDDGREVGDTWRHGDGAGATRGVLFTDKLIYKRGEQIQYKGVVRAIEATGIALPKAGTSVRVGLRDPRGREIAKSEVTMGDLGTFDGALALPVAGIYGDWELRADIGDLRLTADVGMRVYRTPKFRMATTTSARHYVKGDVIAVSTDAGYYSGGPLADAPASIAATSSSTGFTPPGWDGYAFTAGDWGDHIWAPQPFSHAAQGRLGKDGRATFDVPTTAVATTDALLLDFEVTARDPNDEPVAHHAEAWLHPATVVGGVKLGKALVEAGQKAPFSLVATDFDGKPIVGAKLEARVVRREYLQVRQVGVGGQLQWITSVRETDVGGCAPTSAAVPQPCEVAVPDPGDYRVRLTATDPKGRSHRSAAVVWVFGKGAANWHAGGDASETLLPDKPSYKIGDTARILVKNVAKGATALVSEERDGVLRTRMVTLADEAPAIELAIEARHAPNVFVAVAVFQGRSAPAAVGVPDTGAPVLQVAYANLPVATDDRRLAVAVVPERATYRPKEEVAVALTVTDASGKPKAGEVVLWAVDEGVMALSGQKRPDPAESLYAQVALGVRNKALLPELIKGRIGEEKGEDGGGGAGLRGEFRDVPVWLPKIAVGADGKATARFTLPDNLTAFRIMAVAVAGADHAGGGEATIRVDKPLMLLSTFPRQVHVGDEFEAALTVRNRSGAAIAGTGTLQIAADGGEAAISGDAQRACDLAQDGSAELAFRARAVRPGKIKLQVRVQAGAAQDGLEETVEIVDPAVVASVATWGQTAAPVTEAIAKASGARAGVGGVEVKVAATAIAGLDGSLQWLMHYPYGCTEQLASQLQAFLWTERLAQHYDIAKDARDQGRLRAQQAIDKILANRAEGAAALTLWPGSTEPHELATAWALRLLHEASQAGLRTDEAFLKDAAAWLRGRLDSAPAAAAGEDGEAAAPRPAADAHTRAMIVATLAALGQPAHGEVDQLFARRAQLPIDDQLLIAEAAALAGGSAAVKAQAIIDTATRALHVDAATAHLPPADGWAPWGSVVRTNALLLHVIVTAQPDHPVAPRVARWLLEQRRDERWGSTQDNAWALRGLGAWMQRMDRASADSQVEVRLGGKAVGAGKVAARGIAPLVVRVSEAELPAGLAPLVVAPSGGATVHYSVRYDYALQAEAEVARNAGLFVRRLSWDDRGAKAPAEVTRGQTVLVAVMVMCDRHRRDVVVVDQLPAGLEPLDFALKTTSVSARGAFDEVARGLIGEAREAAGAGAPQASFGAASHQELAGREVRWFVDELPAGVHIYTYVARAAVRGGFVGRGARAEAMYAPEVWGSSGPNRLTVK